MKTTSISQLYLDDIYTNQALTKAEEVSMIKKIRTGNKEAEKKFIEANLKFVVQVTRKYKNQGIEEDDLISEGNLGLIEAVKRFNPNKNFKFISYAVWWIRRNILKYIFEQSRPVSMNINYGQKVYFVRKVYNDLQTKLMRNPTIEEVCSAMKTKKPYLAITPKNVAGILLIKDKNISFNKPIPNTTQTFGDYCYDKNQKSPLDIVEGSEKTDIIKKKIGELSDREQYIIISYFGLDNNSYSKYSEISERYSISTERVRQIKKKALQKLKTKLKESGVIG